LNGFRCQSGARCQFLARRFDIALAAASSAPAHDRRRSNPAAAERQMRDRRNLIFVDDAAGLRERKTKILATRIGASPAGQILKWKRTFDPQGGGPNLTPLRTYVSLNIFALPEPPTHCRAPRWVQNVCRGYNEK